MDPRAYWVGFNLVKGIGAVRLQALIDHFGDLQTAWTAPVEQLWRSGLPGRILENWLQIRDQVDLERIWEHIESQGVQVLTWNDPAYPKRLKEIDQPPPVLYVRGRLSEEDQWAVAVVGTRRVTPYGRQVTEELSSFLASNRVTVVSGLARGVDAIAHQSALRSSGSTLAVLGSGVDRIYPPEHRALAEQIIENGAILSDYPLSTPPDSANFPPRNRIISGLTLATVVIEAGETSGALITATFAAEQGREVFAVPGSIYAPQSKGTNRLIGQGARPLLKMEEILEVLDLEHVPEQHAARRVLPVDAQEARLLEMLGPEPVQVDDLCEKSGLPIEQVSATLAVMELKGMVRQVGGMNYSAIRESDSGYETNEHL
jgi:DNA processing protein